MAIELQRCTGPDDDGPGPPESGQERCLVLGVLSDLAADADADADGNPPRPPAWVALRHADLDSLIAALAPRLVFQVANSLTGEGEMAVNLCFRSLQDFSPDRLRDSLPRLHSLQVMRNQLVALRSLLARDPGAEVPADLAPFDPRTDHAATAVAPAPPVEAGQADATDDRPAQRTRPAAGSFQTQVSSAGVWSSRAPRPTPPEPADAAPPRGGAVALVQALVAETLAAAQPKLAGRDPVAVLQQRIDSFDQKIAEQLALVCQAPALRGLQAAWQGLDDLLRSTQACPRVQVRLMAVRRADLAQQLDRHDPAAAWQRLTALARPAVGQAPCCLMLVVPAGAGGEAEAAGSTVWGQAADLAQRFQRSGQIQPLGGLAGALVTDLPGTTLPPTSGP